MSMVDSFEKVTLNIFPDLKLGSLSVAKEIVALSEAIDKITGTSAWIGNGGMPAPPPNSSVKRTQTR